MKELATVYKAVLAAQDALATHASPLKDAPDEKTTIDKLLGILDDQELIKALKVVANIQTGGRPSPESSNVINANYKGISGKLEVTFKNGSVYEYQDVPAEVWEQYQAAESVGKFLAAVKSNYKAEKIH